MIVIGLSDSTQKSKTQSTTGNTYSFHNNPGSADIDKLRNDTFEVDPGLKAEYANLRAGQEKSFGQPQGAYYNPQVKAQMLESGKERLGQQEAQAFREGQFDVNKLKYSRDAAVAGMTAPVFAQDTSSSTGSGTVSQGESPFGTALKVGAAAAPLSM